MIYCDDVGEELSYKFLDPFHPSDAIDVTHDITDCIEDPRNIIMTKSNKKFYIKRNYVYVTYGLDDDTFKELLNKTVYHSNIYSLSVFKTIRNMLLGIIKNEHIYNDIELTNGKLFQFNIKVSG